MNNNMTKKDVWEQVVAVQKDLVSLQEIVFPIQTVREYGEADEDGDALPYSEEVALAKLQLLKELVMAREETLKCLLTFYLKCYEEASD